MTLPMNNEWFLTTYHTGHLTLPLKQTTLLQEPPPPKSANSAVSTPWEQAKKIGPYSMYYIFKYPVIVKESKIALIEIHTFKMGVSSKLYESKKCVKNDTLCITSFFMFHVSLMKKMNK